MTTRTFEVAVAIGASQSRRVWARSERLRTGAWAWVRSTDGGFPANRVFSGEVRDLHHGTEPPTWEAERISETSAVVTMRAKSLTYQARITTGLPGVRYSDNYVDLRPGDEAAITLERLPADFDLTTITVRGYKVE